MRNRLLGGCLFHKRAFTIRYFASQREGTIPPLSLSRAALTHPGARYVTNKVTNHVGQRERFRVSLSLETQSRRALVNARERSRVRASRDQSLRSLTPFYAETIVSRDTLYLPRFVQLAWKWWGYNSRRYDRVSSNSGTASRNSTMSSHLRIEIVWSDARSTPPSDSSHYHSRHNRDEH